MENFVALWSFSQQCFHIETVEEMLDKNLCAFASKRPVDYVPLFVGSHADCSTLVDTLKKTIRRTAA